MIDADKLLRDGARNRGRAANRSKLLDHLRRSTRRSVGMAFATLPLAIFFLWFVCRDYLVSDEPMKKGDVGELVTYGYLITLLFKLGFDSLRPDPKDLLLLEILEEKQKDEN
jgi:hypothetical protein